MGAQVGDKKIEFLDRINFEEYPCSRAWHGGMKHYMPTIPAQLTTGSRTLICRKHNTDKTQYNILRLLMQCNRTKELRTIIDGLDDQIPAGLNSHGRLKEDYLKYNQYMAQQGTIDEKKRMCAIG